MNLTIAGAGSIGLLLAGKFALLPECRVRLVTRTEEQRKKIELQGVTVTEEGLSQNSAVAVDSFEHGPASGGLPDDPDWLLLAVKQKDIDDSLIAALRKWTGEHTRIVLMQNGIGHEEKMNRGFDPSRVYLAVTTEGALRISATEVRHTGRGFTWLGRAAGGAAEDANGKKLTCCFAEAGLPASVSNTIKSNVWNKLLVNAAINPLTALFRVRNGALLDNPKALELMRAIAEEGRKAADCYGIPVDERLWEQILEVCAKTSANESSMLQDIKAGKMTEIDWINGGLIRAARANGIELPVNETVCRLVQSLELFRIDERRG